MAGVIGVTGCDRDEITTYRAPKTPVHAHATPAPPTPSPSEQPIAFDVPAGWRPSPTKQAMRYATFLAGPDDAAIEVAVSVFPGDAGGVIANINRWREQIGLGKVTDIKQLPGAAPINNLGAPGVPPVTGVLLDMTGKSADGSPQRTIAALLRTELGAGGTGSDQTWFVKTSGKPEAIESIKDDVIAFAKSFRLPSAKAPTVSDAASGLGWTAPEHWRRNANASKMLIAEFNAESGAGPVRVTISALGGDGGGALSNINRWRGQVGLPPLTSPEQQPVLPLIVGATTDKPGFPGGLFDMTAPEAKAEGTPRMVIAMIVGVNNSYFLKLTGDAPAVEKEKPAFERFVQSLRIPR
jgi:hypothetical protein